MTPVKKRGKLEIYGDILEAVEAESRWEGGARLTRVQSRSNLAYDRFRKDLTVLEERGLVKLAAGPEGNVSIVLTTTGNEYLGKYRGIRKFLETYGL
jgi:predicted transcriptional regulator